VIIALSVTTTKHNDQTQSIKASSRSCQRHSELLHVCSDGQRTIRQTDRQTDKESITVREPILTNTYQETCQTRLHQFTAEYVIISNDLLTSQVLTVERNKARFQGRFLKW